MVRTRTRFSVFEIWYKTLVDGKALGRFDGWGPEALDDVSPGDTLEFRGHLEIAPIQTVLRLYLWFAQRAKEQGHIFSQKGEELKSTKESERIVRMLLADASEDDDQVVVMGRPNGTDGPTVAMPVKVKWLIGRFGQFGGEYSVVGQVDRILAPGEELPALRLTQEVAASGLEIETLKTSIAGFIEPSAGMGIEVPEGAAVVAGPALWLEPIAIFR